MSEPRDMLQAEGLAKTFTLHLKDGLRLPVLSDMSFTVTSDEAVALTTEFMPSRKTRPLSKAVCPSPVATACSMFQICCSRPMTK